jgi:hypothetical protein
LQIADCGLRPGIPKVVVKKQPWACSTAVHSMLARGVALVAGPSTVPRRNRQSAIVNLQSSIRNRQSAIPNPQSPIRNPQL